LITLDDARPAVPASLPLGKAKPLGIKILEALLFICILSSFLTTIQPAPYEFLVTLLAIACLFARLPVDCKVMPLVFMLLVFEIGGFLSLMQVLEFQDGIKFMMISTYLGLSGMILAVVFSSDCERRYRIMRAGYILAATIAALLGIAGYFKAFPGAEVFMMNNRAVSTFKDPNIFGPFLIMPLLMIGERFLAGEFKLRYVIAGFIILFGLLLAFSRGAWGHFTVSATTMILLLLVTRATHAARRRIVLSSIVAVAAVAVLVTILVSIEEVRQMFLQRATLLQSYDTGTEGSRFNIQQRSIEEMLDHWNGMGPWVFAVQYGLVSHNSYLGTMLNHGWLGGSMYLAMVLTTLVIGFRAALTRAPWQDFLIVAVATYLGLCLESAIVDTDHWRHYYLLLGVIWGMSAATANYVRQQQKTERLSFPDRPMAQVAY
jgi:hypothetical protein